MTTTYLVDAGRGTQQIEAHTETEALALASRYLGAYDWRVVGTIAETEPIPAPTYHSDIIGQRDPLEGED